MNEEKKVKAYNALDAQAKFEEDMKKGGLKCYCSECGNLFRAKPQGFFYVECPICGEDTNGMVSFVAD